jgi:hypothetical protein
MATNATKATMTAAAISAGCIGQEIREPFGSPCRRSGARTVLVHALYTSSPDRGLDFLLELWPRVREQVPDAELHCAYANS